MELIAFSETEQKALKHPVNGMLFPFDYHDFLCKTNGGLVLTTTSGIHLPGVDADVRPQIFLGIYIPKPNNDLVHINDLYRSQLQLPFGSIIFAVDYLGNLFFLNDDKICYWDVSNAFPDSKKKVFYITNSFNKFIGLLGGLDIQRPEIKTPTLIQSFQKAVQTKINNWRKKT